MTHLPEGLMWWIGAIELPALAGLFWMVWNARGETQDEVDRLHHTLDVRCDQLREALHAFKLEVAKGYASQQDLRALEARLVDHLLRIEAKLDATALKAEGLRSEIAGRKAD